ncbi:MAG: lysine 5,6-aminomutase subunit alpha [Candidatus Wallbacteria bacterium]|nr:lysine 5,6-aminomutase subunit alpha [Candidatus Wallbacteria bacterium]
MSKLFLDLQKVNECRELARSVTGQVQQFIDKHTTVTVERATLRLLGLDGVDQEGVPFPNLIVKHLSKKIPEGVSTFFVNGLLRYNVPPEELARQVALGKIDLNIEPMLPLDEILAEARKIANTTRHTILENRSFREKRLKSLPELKKPWLYVIVATGNIYEDVVQATAAAQQGADIIAVIRTTGQSLLDYVPYGATTMGFGGTYATQENFRIMRKALDETGKKIKKYIRQVNYCSGLCMPEIAAMGALERLDMMLNDSMYGILFRDINPRRTFVDQHFSRMINALSGIIINTGEDNYLTTSDAIEKAFTVLASDFINEQFAFRSGMKEELLGLGHAFEMNPDVEDGFLLELSQALLIREIFPNHPLKYMPPTKFMSGDIFKGYLMNAMFNLAAIMTNQGIQLLGMLTEAMHTPFMQDRFLAIKNAKYIMENCRHLGEEVSYRPDGRIVGRARQVLDETHDFLKLINEIGLFTAIERGLFADIKRSPAGGKGSDGVFEKSGTYFNPFYKVFEEELKVRF